VIGDVVKVIRIRKKNFFRFFDGEIKMDTGKIILQEKQMKKDENSEKQRGLDYLQTRIVLGFCRDARQRPYKKFDKFGNHNEK
jgi:hypothetical protein